MAARWGRIVNTMPTYLVERYLPGRNRAWLEAALARLGSQRARAAHLGSTYVPADDSCFCRFEAETEDDVRDATRKRASARAKLVTGMARRIDGQPRSAMPSSASWAWSGRMPRVQDVVRDGAGHAPSPSMSAAWLGGREPGELLQSRCDFERG
jgi:hypothetical protein